MDKTNYRDLLIVDHENTPFVVEVPAFAAEKGDLIRFEDPFCFLRLGQVIDKVGVTMEGDAYRCIAMLKTICRGVAIYKPAWVAECGLGDVEDGRV